MSHIICFYLLTVFIEKKLNMSDYGKMKSKYAVYRIVNYKLIS